MKKRFRSSLLNLKIKWIIVALISLMTLALYTNCSQSSSGSGNNSPTGNVDKPVAELLKTDEFELLGVKYPVELYKLRDSKGVHYVTWTPSKNKSRKVMIISDPYDGISWSGDSVDLKWSSKPNAEVGYLAPDEDGPLYQAGVSQSIFYQLSTIQKSVGFGGIFLPNDISILIVYGRFYAGRGVQDYAKDMASGIQFLLDNNLTDANSFGIFGISLGGFVTLQGSLQSATKPQFAILGSPLIDLKREWQYLDSLNSLITDAAKKTEYASFFEPYRRRIKYSIGGTPSEVPASYTPYTVDDIKNRINFPTLIMQDTWDTLTPSSFITQLESALVPNMEFLWFTHETPINFNTFTKDHLQPSEGMNNMRMLPFYQLYALLNLHAPTVQLFTDVDELNYSFNYFRTSQLNGHAINWLKPHLIRFCDPKVSIVDFSAHHYPAFAGSIYIQGLLKGLWNHDLSETAACTFVKTHELNQY